LPAALRRRSGIEPGDRVVIVIEDQDSFRLPRLEPAGEMLRRLRGKSGDLVETGSGCDLLRVRWVCQDAAGIVDAVQ
jgi:bifunctional DNA-binding transcriptional regulator/antitoxin component of YhaV-PrlF toxin-antitoxin module